MAHDADVMVRSRTRPHIKSIPRRSRDCTDMIRYAQYSQEGFNIPHPDIYQRIRQFPEKSKKHFRPIGASVEDVGASGSEPLELPATPGRAGVFRHFV